MCIVYIGDKIKKKQPRYLTWTQQFTNFKLNKLFILIRGQQLVSFTNYTIFMCITIYTEYTLVPALSKTMIIVVVSGKGDHAAF